MHISYPAEIALQNSISIKKMGLATRAPSKGRTLTRNLSTTAGERPQFRSSVADQKLSVRYGVDEHRAVDWAQIESEQRIRAKHLHILQMKLDLIEVNQRLRQVRIREQELAGREVNAFKKQSVCVTDLAPKTWEHHEGGSQDMRSIANRPSSNRHFPCPTVPNPEHKAPPALHKPLGRSGAVRRSTKEVYSVPATLWSGKEPVGLRRIYGVGKPAVRLSSGRLISNRSKDDLTPYKRPVAAFKLRDAANPGIVKNVNTKKLTIMENRLNRLSQRVEREIDLLVSRGMDPIDLPRKANSKTSSFESTAGRSNSVDAKHDRPREIDYSKAVTFKSRSKLPESSKSLSENPKPLSVIEKAEDASHLAQQPSLVAVAEDVLVVGDMSIQIPLSDSRQEEIPALPEPILDNIEALAASRQIPLSRRSAACQTSFSGYVSNNRLPELPRKAINTPVLNMTSAYGRTAHPPARPAPTESQVTLQMLYQPAVSHDELSRLAHRLSSNRIDSQEGHSRTTARGRVPIRRVQVQYNKSLPYYNAKAIIGTSVDSLAPASSVESLLLSPTLQRRRVQRQPPLSQLNPHHQRERIAQPSGRRRKDASSVSLGVRMNDRAVYDGYARQETENGASRLRRLMGREGRAKFRMALFGV